MACQINGLTAEETALLTKHMATSGATFSPSPGRVDKHSTGGVGDKMSLVLAPCLAAAGLVVPMLAGRGLAHTGGTIDKLEAIPGFNTGLSLDEMRTNPCFISRQTEGIAPADRILYAARDVTATVPQIGLITASIVSKKFAEGLERLVLDYKCVRAAFKPTLEEARALARSMVDVGSALGMEVTAQITSMDHPIGRLLGNAHEVAESVACLKGEGPEDTMELVRMQGAALGADVDAVIADGSALDAFAQMCRRQGVDEATVMSLIADPWSVLPRGRSRTTLVAPSSGWIATLTPSPLVVPSSRSAPAGPTPTTCSISAQASNCWPRSGAGRGRRASGVHRSQHERGRADLAESLRHRCRSRRGTGQPLLETVGASTTGESESKRRLWGSNPRPWD